jgi:hypothetical protein
VTWFRPIWVIVEPAITIAAPRTASREIRRRETSNYDWRL